MIRLELGAEPDVLRQERGTRLPEAVRLWNLWQASALVPDKKAFTESITGYRVSVDDLHRLQYGKCAYCERPTGKAGSPVEHFRPKNGAEHENGAVPGRDPERYWWMAWTWDNLLFACATCNSQANKGNRFPLEAGSPTIQAPTAPAALPLPDACFDVGVEKRLFIHPRLDDPLEHLEWAPVNRAASPVTWHLVVTGRTPQGSTTKEVLELDLVVEDVQHYLRAALWPWVEILEADKATGNASAVRHKWNSLVQRLLDAPESQFRGPCYWAMRHLFDRLGLSQLGCVAPRAPFVRH